MWDDVVDDVLKSGDRQDEPQLCACGVRPVCHLVSGVMLPSLRNPDNPLFHHWCSCSDIPLGEMTVPAQPPVTVL